MSESVLELLSFLSPKSLSPNNSAVSGAVSALNFKYCRAAAHTKPGASCDVCGDSLLVWVGQSAQAVASRSAKRQAGLSWEDVAGALSVGADASEQVKAAINFVEMKYLEAHSNHFIICRWLFNVLCRLALRFGWGFSARQLNGLAALSLAQNLKPKMCGPCSGRGEVKIGASVRPCASCDGHGQRVWTDQDCADYLSNELSVAISRQTFNKYYKEAARMAFFEVSVLNFVAEKHIRNQLFIDDSSEAA